MNREIAGHIGSVKALDLVVSKKIFFKNWGRKPYKRVERSRAVLIQKVTV